MIEPAYNIKVFFIIGNNFFEPEEKNEKELSQRRKAAEIAESSAP